MEASTKIFLPKRSFSTCLASASLWKRIYKASGTTASAIGFLVDDGRGGVLLEGVVQVTTSFFGCAMGCAVGCAVGCDSPCTFAFASPCACASFSTSACA